MGRDLWISNPWGHGAVLLRLALWKQGGNRALTGPLCLYGVKEASQILSLVETDRYRLEVPKERAMSLTELQQRASSRRRVLDAELGKLASIESRLESVHSEVVSLSQKMLDLEQVSIVLNSIGEERQTRAQHVIEELVTRGLQTIFDESLSFHIVQSVKGKTSSVEFFVRTHLPNKTVIDTPVMEARGGGLSATIGFLLRVVVLLLRNGTSSENILVLDESFAHVSAEYLDRVGEFLRELVEKTGIQIILVTHQQELVDYGDAVYKFTQIDGDTKVEQV